MSSIEGTAAMSSGASQQFGPASANRAGETDFGALIQQAQFDITAQTVPKSPASSPPAAAGGAPTPDMPEAINVTVRASDPSISERVGSRIDTLNEARLFERGAREAPPASSTYSIGADARPEGPVAALGVDKAKSDPFDAAVRNLQGAFHHAIEVEMVAKTGTSLNSSMNKLMSGQ